MSPPKLCPARFDEFAGRARVVSDAGLALEFALSESSARRWRLRLGVCRPAPSVRYWGCGEVGGLVLPPARYEEFKRLAATWSNTQLSVHFEFARGTVRRYREKFDVWASSPEAAAPSRPVPTRPALRQRHARSRKAVVIRWRCWRCERLVVEVVCPGCQGSFGK